MYEDRSDKGHNTSSDGSTWFKNDSGNGFWGTKLDWNINDNHSLALLAFSDEGDVTNASYGYNWNADQLGAWGGDSVTETRRNWSATYTGHFGQNFTRAMVGQNNQRAFTNSSLDQACSPVFTDSTYGPRLGKLQGLRAGCHPTARQWPSVTIPVTWRDWTSNGSWVTTCCASVSTVS